MIQWLIDNWLMIAIPVLVFLATWIVGLWVRRILYSRLTVWTEKTNWEGTGILIGTTRRPFLLWCLLLGTTIAIQVSTLLPGIKSTIDRTIGSLFVVSLVWVLAVLGEQFLRLYLPRAKASERTISLSGNILRTVIVVVGMLVILDIWGVPTTPLLLLILVTVLASALAFRTAAPNLFAGFHLSASEQIKVGDYIRLETGEEGYITEMSWSNTRIKALNESTVIIPNNRLLQHTITNYGHPLKSAKEPFYFMSRTYLKELTGLKAKNLSELAAILKKVPDAVIDYHTHHFLEEHHYLTPEPSNDFAVWISDTLGDEVLGERLASIDTFGFPNLGTLRERLVSIIEECLATGSNLRQAMAGREFYFVKSVSVIIPTSYVVHDFREFVEALRKVSAGSIYYHVFESRLRLGKGTNDFSIWLKESLDEAELGDEIARLDPYTYTLEGLRSTLIRLIEKRIK